MGRLRAIPRLFHSHQKTNENVTGAESGECQESSGAASRSSHSAPARHGEAPGPGHQASTNQKSGPAQVDAALDTLIAGVFAASGYSLSRQQADELRRTIAGFTQAAADNPGAEAHRGQKPLENGPVPGASGGAPNLYGANAGPGPQVATAPSSPGAELMTRARQLERTLPEQNPGLTLADVAELLSLVRRLGQLFFEQGRDKVTHQQFQAEIGSLKRLIESKGK